MLGDSPPSASAGDSAKGVPSPFETLAGDGCVVGSYRSLLPTYPAPRGGYVIPAVRFVRLTPR